MSHTEEVFLKEIECPVCFHYMPPPIRLCKIGHSVCGNCAKRLDKCPVCQSAYVTNNKPLEKIASKVKMMRKELPKLGSHHSPLDLIDEQHAKLTIAEEIGKIVLMDIKCELCLDYSFSIIYFCVNGHSTCHSCQLCTKCNEQATNGRNFALETIANCIEFPCRYKKLGCSAILTLSDSQHEKVCEFKTINCPLSLAAVMKCLWFGKIEDLKFHLMQEHVASNVLEGPSATLCIMYTSNTVLFAFKRMFVISVLIMNGSVFYRIFMEDSTNDADEYKCIHVLLIDNVPKATIEIHPSSDWIEIGGSDFNRCIDSKVLLKVRICKA